MACSWPRQWWNNCEDPPGIRHNGKLKIYLAYLRDPAGNKLCCAYLLPKISEN